MTDEVLYQLYGVRTNVQTFRTRHVLFCNALVLP